MTSWQHDDYLALRALAGREPGSWLEDNYLEGRSPQWWNSLLDSCESEILGKLHRNEPMTSDIFRFGLSVLRRAERDSMDVGLVAHWLLLLARLAKRSAVPAAELPNELTPDESARYAISLIPLSRDQAVALAHRRNDALLSDGPATISDREIHAVQDCELIISTLLANRELILDEELRSQLDGWSAAYLDMAPRKR